MEDVAVGKLNKADITQVVREAAEALLSVKTIWDDRLYTTEEMAKLYDIKPQTAALWRTKGKGPSYTKIGSKVRYQGSDLKEGLKRRKVHTT